MHLQIHKFASAAAGTLGLVYLLCATFVVVAPAAALQLLGWLMHIVNVDKFAGEVAVTWPGLIFGFAQTVIYTYVMMVVFAWLHNRFVS
jgi:hypothetical protein